MQWIAYGMCTSMYTRSIRKRKPGDESFKKVLKNLHYVDAVRMIEECY